MKEEPGFVYNGGNMLLLGEAQYHRRRPSNTDKSCEICLVREGRRITENAERFPARRPSSFPDADRLRGASEMDLKNNEITANDNR